MDMLTLFLIALSLSMDAFAVAVCKGLASPGYRLSHSAACGAWFGGFQALMPLVGFFLGIGMRGRIAAFDHWIAFALLGLIGFGMIRAALRHEEKNTGSSYSPRVMAVLAVATSIDALAIGITFAFLSVNIGFAVTLIGICTFLLSALGVKIGSVFGAKYRFTAELIGGIVLVILGIRILLEHLMG